MPPQRSAPRRGRKRNERPVKKRYVTVDHMDYKDVDMLRRFISERGKIKARRTTGLSRVQQRQLGQAVKRARELALLPYPN